jgi:hypothetical protein
MFSATYKTRVQSRGGKMQYLYLDISFYKISSEACKNILGPQLYPEVHIRNLKSWDGEKGDYEWSGSLWTCFKSYLNEVSYRNNAYRYGTVIQTETDDYKVINDVVQLAFNKVKEYVEIEIKDKDLVFNRYQEFLDNGGFPIKR